MSDAKPVKWGPYARVFLDVMSQRGARGFGFMLVIVVMLGVAMVRMLASHKWLAAAVCLLIMLAPIAVGVWLWRRSRKIALEEARQAQSPLNLP